MQLMVVWEVLKHSVAIIKMLMLKLILVPVMTRYKGYNWRPVLQEQNYQVQVEGQTYFVGQDNNTNTNGFTLLKQNSTGYEKVQVGGKDVQLANFDGRVRFVEDNGSATSVDLAAGKMGKALAYNDAQCCLQKPRCPPSTRYPRESCT